MEYKLYLYHNARPIVFKYLENHYPLMNTEVVHYDTYKLNIMLSDGLAAILSDRGDIYNTFAGDLLFFNPAQTHHGRILRQGVHRYIEVLIPTHCFPRYDAFHALFKTEGNLISPPTAQRAVLFTLAERIKTAIVTPDADAALLGALSELTEHFVSLHNQSNNQNIPAALQSAMDYIRREYARDLQIADIAAAAHCSPSYLSRIFKKFLASSPHRYLTEYRLFMAEKLLRHGSSVTESAALCGFSDTSSFIRCFKDSFGVTPLKYKTLHKQKDLPVPF